MKITQDVRDFAADVRTGRVNVEIAETEAASLTEEEREAGMEDMSKKYDAEGRELYKKVS